jgi:hypothetical protein
MRTVDGTTISGNLGNTGPPVLPVEGVGLDVIQATVAPTSTKQMKVLALAES